MRRETSIYLDLCRFVAALAVLLFHLRAQRLTGGFAWQMEPYGSQAVTVFFVLSGFVIAYVAETRERDPAAYAAGRIARIYSVALPALAATFALDAAGRALAPGLYTTDWGFQDGNRLIEAVTGLLFVHEWWFVRVVPGSNLPYWSLGFEVWYYAVFGLAVFAPPRLRWWLAGAALLVAGPKIACMFPLWLLGVLAWHVASRRRPGPRVGLALWAGSLLAYIGYELLARRFGRPFGLAPEVLKRPELAQDYLVAVLFATNLVGLDAAAPLFSRVLGAVARPVRWLAGATFTLYLFHMPLAQFLAACVAAYAGWAPGSGASRVIVLGGTLVTVFAVAAVTERRKGVWLRPARALVARLA